MGSLTRHLLTRLAVLAVLPLRCTSSAETSRCESANHAWGIDSDATALVQSVKPQLKEFNRSVNLQQLEQGSSKSQSSNMTLDTMSSVKHPDAKGWSEGKPGTGSHGGSGSKLVQVLAAARSTAQEMVRPSATFVFVAPFLIMTIVLIACFAALFSFSADCRTFAPSEYSQDGSSWPRSQRTALTPASRRTQDPYLALSQQSLPPKDAPPGDASVSGRPSVGPGLGPGPASRMSLASQASAASRRVPPLRLSAISAAGRPTGDMFMASAAPLQPLFPALVLPAREGQLEVSLDAVQTVQKTGAGRFFVIGPLGNKILHITSCGSAFDVHMAQRSSELVSKVSLKEMQDSSRIEVCRGDGTVYGKIVEHEQPQKSLDEVSLSVIVTSSSGKAERAMLVIQGNPERFCLTAKAAADGQPVASIELQAYSEEHYLDLRTSRGADTALIVSSFLGILLLRDRPDRPRQSVPRPLMSGA
ncbi:NEK1 [Symbiodinium sp. CCMP2592]|nr:NEK1 [Symbiodinium sp. CCMP2592]